MNAPAALMITDPNQPPRQLRMIERIVQTNRFGTRYPWTFFVHDGLLTIMSRVDKVDSETGASRTLFGQREFPIGVAQWIVDQLTPFKREGIFPGSIFVLETEIGGESIGLIRGVEIGGPGIPGFDLTNRSRKDHKMPRFNQEFPMPDPFLWEQGLFELWERIADEHRRGLY